MFNRGHGIRHDLFERAIELERSAGEAIPTYYLPSTTYGTLLRIENDLDAARPLLEQAVARARRRGEEGGDVMPLLVRLAWLESEAGNPAAADRWLAKAEEAARLHVNDEMDSWVAHAKGEIAASRGQLDQARLGAEECSAWPSQAATSRCSATETYCWQTSSCGAASPRRRTGGCSRGVFGRSRTVRGTSGGSCCRCGHPTSRR